LPRTRSKALRAGRTAECRRVESLCSVFFKIDRIPYFDIRHSKFDIRYSLLPSFFLDWTERWLPAAPLIFMK
jgi:hypothetical protein